ncbi:MAG: hypothetical protein KatS3mg101_1102 [Patescibacteria group bacterium]|nr:MAG: hypothetical protein KatS3mg101_1102 [Patescibacteria group bacterium]
MAGDLVHGDNMKEQKTNKTEDAAGIVGKIRVITYKAGTKEIKRKTEWIKNLIVVGSDTGKNLILKRLAGVNTYTLNITHADIGTGQNPPSSSDTTLQTPVARGTIGGYYFSGNNIVTLQFFFSDALLPNGTYYEFGTFIDGTGTVSTGRLFNRALFGTPYTKSSGEDTTVEVQIEIN